MMPLDYDLMRPLSEVLWLYQWFRKAKKSAPKREWRWAPVSPSWDRQEVVERFRSEATTDEAVIWQAVSERESSGRWPRLSVRAGHFLRERLHEGEALCSEILRKRGPLDPAVRATQPPDAEALVRSILIDHWNSTGVQYWIEDNQDTFQERDPDEPDPDYEA
jgi:hypothetical protein